MSRRYSLALFLSVLMFSPVLFAQRGQSGPRIAIPQQPNELKVRIVFPNDRPPAGAMQYRIQLLSAGGAPVRDVFTDGTGEADFSGIQGGTYTILVTGPGIEDSAVQVQMERLGGQQFEFVRVRPSSRPAEPMPRQQAVSARQANIPEKAQKELKKGNKALAGGDLKGAREHYQKAAEIHPGYASAENNLGAVCLETQDFACARVALEKAVAADPGSGHALLNLGKLRMIEHNYPEAEGLLQRATAAEPANPQVLTAMAEAKLALRKFPDATLYARRVHSIPHQGLGMAHWIAAQALEAQGKPEEAVVEYRTFLKEAPDDPAAEQARGALSRLDHQANASTPRQ